eukprot:4281500-Alexandrium_andersonii.AAC.1
MLATCSLAGDCRNPYCIYSCTTCYGLQAGASVRTGSTRKKGSSRPQELFGPRATAPAWLPDIQIPR